MKFTLTINERIISLGILNQFKGNLDALSKILDDLKIIRIEEDEAKEIELVQEDNKIVWNPTKAKEKEIELSKESVDWIKTFIKEKNEKGDFTLADKDIIGLQSKLE